MECGLKNVSDSLFPSLNLEQILADLDKSHRQIEAGEGIPADVAMEEIGGGMVLMLFRRFHR